VVEFADLPTEAREQGLVLGVRSPRQPVVLDPYRDPGLMIIG
jgi:hypothetical protein